MAKIFLTELQQYELNYIRERAKRLNEELSTIEDDLLNPVLTFEEREKLNRKAYRLIRDKKELVNDYKELLSARDEWLRSKRRTEYLEKKWGFCSND